MAMSAVPSPSGHIFRCAILYFTVLNSLSLLYDCHQINENTFFYESCKCVWTTGVPLEEGRQMKKTNEIDIKHSCFARAIFRVFWLNRVTGRAGEWKDV